MSVRIPIAGNPLSPRPSGIMSFVLGLGAHLVQNGTDVEYLCAGGEGDTAGGRLVSIAPEGSGNSVSHATSLGMFGPLRARLVRYTSRTRSCMPGR